MALDEEQHAQTASTESTAGAARPGVAGYTNHVAEYAEDVTGGLSPEREGGVGGYTAGRADRTP